MRQTLLVPDLTALGQQVASEAAPLNFVPNAPNVCLTPSPAGPVPVPYPITGDTSALSHGCESVLHQGQPTMNVRSKLQAVRGNEAGSGGDVVTGVNRGTAWAVSGAPSVLFEGAAVVTAGAPAFGNCIP